MDLAFVKSCSSTCRFRNEFHKNETGHTLFPSENILSAVGGEFPPRARDVRTGSPRAHLTRHTVGYRTRTDRTRDVQAPPPCAELPVPRRAAPRDRKELFSARLHSRPPRYTDLIASAGTDSLSRTQLHRCLSPARAHALARPAASRSHGGARGPERDARRRHSLPTRFASARWEAPGPPKKIALKRAELSDRRINAAPGPAGAGAAALMRFMSDL
ncbi:hypothetical protein EVAR_76396_1 [Eumeta japonica]|uniref:Uncharacterized protein n=1 Tax=Eumeta variegata TaxID=151549 RepID=A0A4C1T7S0_EUMVA|nr:hypothetical protein EVAR_76396_1 [Eumeta japonica]